MVRLGGAIGNVLVGAGSVRLYFVILLGIWMVGVGMIGIVGVGMVGV